MGQAGRGRDGYGPAQFGEFIKADIAKWAKVIELANIKVN